MLKNPDFELDWEEESNHQVLVLPVGADPYVHEVGNIFTPPGWLTWHRDGGLSQLAQPEVRDSRVANRVQNGEKAMLLFSYNRRHDAGFLQQITELEPGSLVTFRVWAHAWSNHNMDHPHDPGWSEGAGYDEVAWREGTMPGNTGDPQTDAKPNFTFLVGIDPAGGTNPMADSVVWCSGWHIYNGYVKELVVQANALGDTVTVFLRSYTMWAFEHNDAYWDNCGLQVDPPAGGDDRGKPREQYARTYVLLPPATTPEAARLWAENAARAWDVYPYTIGPSADDGGIGDLDARTVLAVNPQKWGPGEDGQGLFGFFKEHYPGVDARQILANEPADLAGLLRRPLSEHANLEPHEGTPAGNGDPPDYPTYRPEGTTGFTSIQALSDGILGFGQFHDLLRPPVTKTVLASGQLGLVAQYSPLTLFCHRHWNGRDNDYKMALGFNGHAHAAFDWCAEFMPGLIEDLRSRGLAGTPENPRRVLVESINETYDHDLAGNWNAVQFDIQFVYRVAEWNNETPDFEFVPVVFTAAVGNPPRLADPHGGLHWEQFFELAQVAQDYGAVFGPHAYWFADWDRPFLVEQLGPYLQYRWVGFDRTLREHGFYLNWFLGETGAVGGMYEPATGDLWMNPGSGWRHAYGATPQGWARMLAECKMFDQELARLNDAEFGGRIIGHTLFAAGGSDDWAHFQITGSRLTELATVIFEAYG